MFWMSRLDNLEARDTPESPLLPLKLPECSEGANFVAEFFLRFENCMLRGLTGLLLNLSSMGIGCVLRGKSLSVFSRPMLSKSLLVYLGCSISLTRCIPSILLFAYDLPAEEVRLPDDPKSESMFPKAFFSLSVLKLIDKKFVDWCAKFFFALPAWKGIGLTSATSTVTYWSKVFCILYRMGSLNVHCLKYS